MKFFKACMESEIPAKGMLLKNIDGVAILFARTARNELVAFENRCSHQDKPLWLGPWNAERGEITCPYHKAIFNVIEGGRATCAPAVSPIQVFELDLRSEAEGDAVYVALDDAD